jgi:hypothetical protein
VDGGDIFPAEYGGSRPDIATAYGNDSLERTEFKARIPTGPLTLGPHALSFRLLAADRQGWYESAPWSFTVIPQAASSWSAFARKTRGAIESVERFGDRLLVRGWAIDDVAADTAIGVFVMVDDRWRIDATYGSFRPDVAKMLSDPVYADSGFSATVRTSGLARGSHTLRCCVLAKAFDGYYELPGTKEFEAP